MNLATEHDHFTARGQWCLSWMQRILLVTGFFALAYVAYVLLEARIFQQVASATLEKQLGAEKQHSIIPTGVAAQEGDVLGRLEIPRIGLSVMVLQGTTPKTLLLGAGHINGTAFPGESGNIGIAGHRDTFFRSLKEIHRDDEILLQTGNGASTYIVDWIQITTPSDGEIVSMTTTSALTLVTCYPFHYVGAAPERYVVHAHKQ